MKLYRLAATQDLPIDADAAWVFFSDPSNLLAITPPDASV